jgi:hypothetical protein
VQKLSPAEVIFPEVQRLFKDRGLVLESRGVEKVLVGRAGKLPYGMELVQQGVDPTARLPYDAMVHFSVKKLP